MQTPAVPRPIWGVNWDETDRLLILGGGGLVELILAPAVGLCTLATAEQLRRVFEPEHDCQLLWEGRQYAISGPYCGGPNRISPSGERVEFHPDLDNTIAVLDGNGEVVRQVLDDFLRHEDRWMVADFTLDFRYIVAFDPDELRVYRQQVEAELLSQPPTC